MASNWIMGEVSRRLNKENVDIAACPVAPDSLAWLIRLIRDGEVSTAAAKTVFDTLWGKQNSIVANLTAPMLTFQGSVNNARSVVMEVIDRLGLKQMSDTGELEAILDTVIAANTKSVEEYRAGNAKAFNALVGQAMKATKGKGNPAQVNELLKKKLA